MVIFCLFFLFLVTQRITELIIAKKNEKWMKSNGAFEVGQEHYNLIVSTHVLFFMSFCIEVLLKGIELSQIFPIIFTFFILSQFMRIWAIASLGRYWNTKIIIMPNAEIIKKGPYQYLRHPNYVVVTLELIIIPLLFNAYITATIFTLLNVLVLSIRIPAEEKALELLTNYEEQFSKTGRFIPKSIK
ncbi:isoprenylcysteine carboxyl methyltransferase family protein [Litchfieldia salsa]|uniref:15-methylpalmitoyl-4-hydroxy-2-pyrone 4-O-methyltransferase n=1 Tax=Litchfieldia salsa TaxID=930152 RepID=A0A1H0TJ98_9BACI|nr:isoprenylcysteine carboxylmethyltransferase family protein [Litchfieldia salsa]SDP53616.1 15-methylpalmitoyl-4-hydroxy-2-pyrone 4-O-methyltransferase [Litchfieldia salsa]